MARPYLSTKVEERVRAAGRNRCGYCLSPQHLVMARLEVEHILPIAKGGAAMSLTYGWPVLYAIAIKAIKPRRWTRKRARPRRSSTRAPKYGLSIFAGLRTDCVSSG